MEPVSKPPNMIFTFVDIYYYPNEKNISYTSELFHFLYNFDSL